MKQFELRRVARGLLAWLSLSAAAVTAAVAVAGATAGAAATDSIMPRVDAAWIRWLPGTVPAAGYLTLTNAGDRPAVLLSASSPLYGDISLHRTVNRAGSMEMAAVDRITIPPHATLAFETTGYHLMLMQPAASVRPGVHVTITLQFAEGPRIPVDFEVRNPDGSRAAPRG
jgi:copper(I)-binding protein